MRNEETTSGTMPAEGLDELTTLLATGSFEEFMRLFKQHSKDMKEHGGPVTLVEMLNKHLETSDPPACDMKLVVSQKTDKNKHLVMIMDHSRLWGDSYTITRQM